MILGSYCPSLTMSRDVVLNYNYEGIYTVTSDLCYGRNQFYMYSPFDKGEYFITFSGDECRWLLVLGNITCGMYSPHTS